MRLKKFTCTEAIILKMWQSHWLIMIEAEEYSRQHLDNSVAR